MMARKKRITADELMESLHNDPEWVRQHEARQAARRSEVARLQAEFKPEEAPLLAALLEAGYQVNSVWDLVNTRESYTAAIPVLARFLAGARHPVIREGIARALTVPQARGTAGPLLLAELSARKDPPGSEARWALANALTVAGDQSLIAQIRDLAADARFEDVRERLETALKCLGGR